jgi:hypothetical protein
MMARVWLLRFGQPVSAGTPLTDKPFPECASKLKLNKMNFLGVAASKIQFGKPDDALAQMKGFHHVVVAVLEPEAGANGWKPGYYLAPATAHDAAQRLGVKLPAPK